MIIQMPQKLFNVWLPHGLCLGTRMLGCATMLHVKVVLPLIMLDTEIPNRPVQSALRKLSLPSHLSWPLVHKLHAAWLGNSVKYCFVLSNLPGCGRPAKDRMQGLCSVVVWPWHLVCALSALPLTGLPASCVAPARWRQLALLWHKSLQSRMRWKVERRRLLSERSS